MIHSYHKTPLKGGAINFVPNLVRTKRRTIEGYEVSRRAGVQPGNRQLTSGLFPELPGCSSAGVTEDEACSNIEETTRLYLAPIELPAEDGKLSEVTIG